MSTRVMREVKDFTLSHTVPVRYRRGIKQVRTCELRLSCGHTVQKLGTESYWCQRVGKTTRCERCEEAE